jgi:3-methyladenine DNA glycosylase Tag
MFGLAKLMLSGPRARGVLMWPGIVEHEEEPHECDQRQLVEKKRRHHGHAPSDGGEMRAFYRVSALSELSAGLGYTTHRAKKGEFVKCFDHFDLLQTARN